MKPITESYIKYKGYLKKVDEKRAKVELMERKVAEITDTSKISLLF